MALLVLPFSARAGGKSVFWLRFARIWWSWLRSWRGLRYYLGDVLQKVPEIQVSDVGVLRLSRQLRRASWFWDELANVQTGSRSYHGVVSFIGTFGDDAAVPGYVAQSQGPRWKLMRDAPGMLGWERQDIAAWETLEQWRAS